MYVPLRLFKSDACSKNKNELKEIKSSKLEKEFWDKPFEGKISENKLNI